MDGITHRSGQNQVNDMATSSPPTPVDITQSPSTAINGQQTSSANDIEEQTAESSASSPIHEEYQYLNLIRKILAEGEHRPDRYVMLWIRTHTYNTYIYMHTTTHLHDT